MVIQKSVIIFQNDVIMMIRRLAKPLRTRKPVIYLVLVFFMCNSSSITLHKVLPYYIPHMYTLNILRVRGDNQCYPSATTINYYYKFIIDITAKESDCYSVEISV